jgi:hypothetical protein
LALLVKVGYLFGFNSQGKQLLLDLGLNYGIAFLQTKTFSTILPKVKTVRGICFNFYVLIVRKYFGKILVGQAFE